MKGLEKTMDKRMSVYLLGLASMCALVLLFNCRSTAPRVEVAPAATMVQVATTSATTAEDTTEQVESIVTEPSRVAEELWSVHPLEPKLVGKWEAIDGKPLPTVEFFNAREGSKTPWNVTFQTERMAGGCGFDAAMDAWCAVYDDTGKSVPRRVKTTIAILTNGSALRVAIDQLFKVDVHRVETQAKR